MFEAGLESGSTVRFPCPHFRRHPECTGLLVKSVQQAAGHHDAPHARFRMWQPLRDLLGISQNCGTTTGTVHNRRSVAQDLQKPTEAEVASLQTDRSVQAPASWVPGSQALGVLVRTPHSLVKKLTPCFPASPRIFCRGGWRRRVSRRTKPAQCRRAPRSGPQGCLDEER